MSRRLAPYVASLLLVTVAAACTGGDGEDLPPGPPAIELLLPEPGTRARHTIAFAGTTTGGVRRVELVVDGGEPLVADGREEWSLVEDVSHMADGAHVVVARALGRGDEVAESAPRSFITIADAIPGTGLLAGTVRNADSEPIPGATVTTVQDATRSTTSNLIGDYALTNLDPDAVYVVRATAPGFLATNMYELGGNSDNTDLNISMFNQGTVEFLADAYGVTQDPAKGVVLGFLLARGAEAGFDGAVVTIDPPPPEGTFYVGPGNDFDPALQATTSQGSFVAFNVTPGPVHFTATAGTAAFFTLGSVAATDTLSFMIGIEVLPP